MTESNQTCRISVDVHELDIKSLGSIVLAADPSRELFQSGIQKAEGENMWEVSQNILFIMDLGSWSVDLISDEAPETNRVTWGRNVKWFLAASQTANSASNVNCDIRAQI